MYDGTMKVYRYDTMRRWRRVAGALARYIGDDLPTTEQMAAKGWAEGVSDTLDTIAEYMLFRSLAKSATIDPRVSDAERVERQRAAQELRTVMAHAIAAR